MRVRVPPPVPHFIYAFAKESRAKVHIFLCKSSVQLFSNLEVGAMPRTKVVEKSNRKKSRPPALSIEDRENQLIARAVDLAEQQLIDGTASSQVITHYLKLGSTRERLEKERLQEENELLRAKTEALKSSKNIEELFTNAIDAMRKYGGNQ